MIGLTSIKRRNSFRKSKFAHSAYFDPPQKEGDLLIITMLTLDSAHPSLNLKVNLKNNKKLIAIHYIYCKNCEPELKQSSRIKAFALIQRLTELHDSLH